MEITILVVAIRTSECGVVPVIYSGVVEQSKRMHVNACALHYY
jgi:hypothetical protein